MRRSASNPGVSLFPFLAVLICTMGVMMLLLIVMNRPGVDGDGDGPGGDDPSGGEKSSLAMTAPAHRARRARSPRDAGLAYLAIANRREKTQNDLADRRQRLSVVEVTMRDLRDQWKSLERAAHDLDQAGQAKLAAESSTADQSARLQQQIAATRRAAAEAVERRQKEPPSFAIVPYEGPNGTRRRPIYIECLPDTVVLQPEGIVFSEQDFAGPSGPGNPLATTLRAVRDYMTTGAVAGQGEPYPLLIVRPDGIAAFYIARDAMSSWASEFGYELIEQDRKLAYPAPDPEMARIEAAALADARSRYAWFAQTRTGRKESAGTASSLSRIGDRRRHRARRGREPGDGSRRHGRRAARKHGFWIPGKTGRK